MKNKFFVKVAIYSLAILLLSSNAISPVMRSLSSAFPERSSAEIQMIQQISAFVGVPFCLFGGTLAHRIDKKLLIIIGLICFIIGASGYFAQTYIMLLVTRVFIGIADGIIEPCVLGLAADNFYGTDEYSRVVGYEHTFKSVGRIVLVALAGALCAISWHHVFLMYLIALPILVIVILWVPASPSREDKSRLHGTRHNHADHENEVYWKKRFKIPPILLPTLILAFLVSFCQNISHGNISYLIEDNGFGNSVTTGMMSSTMAVSGIVASSLFANFDRKLKGTGPILGTLFLTAGLFLCAKAGSLSGVITGVIVMGLGFGVFTPSLMMQVGRIQQRNATLYFAFVMATMDLASFLQGQIVPRAAAALFGGSGVGKSAYLFGAFLCFLALLYAALLWYKQIRPQEKNT